MTKAQEIAVKKFVEGCIETFSYSKDAYEVKNKEVQENESGAVFVSVEIGLKGDENTLASALGRSRASTFIGKNGGYYSYRHVSNKRCTLTLHQAIWFDFKQGKIRESQLIREKSEVAR